MGLYCKRDERENKGGQNETHHDRYEPNRMGDCDRGRLRGGLVRREYLRAEILDRESGTAGAHLALATAKA